MTGGGGRPRPTPVKNWVDMGLPSGTKWASTNLDATKGLGFAESEYEYDGTFVSWGNTQGLNPTSDVSFLPGTFGSANDEEPYSTSPGADITYPSSIDLQHDAARANCGYPWRIPTVAEIQELLNNCDFIDNNGNVIPEETENKMTTMNSVTGIRLRSRINQNILFFAAGGFGTGSQRGSRGAHGYYWSSNLSSNAKGRCLSFANVGVYPGSGDDRFRGYLIRPVRS